MDRQRLIAILKHDEGIKQSAYTDSEGFLTIGVGRLIDERKGGRLLDDEIDYLLNNDIDRVINQAIRNFPWYRDLNHVRQEIVLSMIFNLGLEGFRKFKLMIAALARHDWTDASREMLDSKWAGQVGQRSVRLSEAMRTGQWTADSI